jgi:hypothetical protein
MVERCISDNIWRERGGGSEQNRGNMNSTRGKDDILTKKTIKKSEH